jgi:hypothetical protein
VRQNTNIASFDLLSFDLTNFEFRIVAYIFVILSCLFYFCLCKLLLLLLALKLSTLVRNVGLGTFWVFDASTLSIHFVSLLPFIELYAQLSVKYNYFCPPLLVGENYDFTYAMF